MAPEAQPIFPLPESKGGWRVISDRDGARTTAGIELDRLSPARAWNEQFPVASAVVIIRRGRLVAEWYANGAQPDTRFNIHSCTKSFTGTAYGLLLEDSRQGRPPVPPGIDLDTPAYPHIPAGYPLTDPRKEHITLRHLLSMSSGIPGESTGIYGVVVETGINPFEAALGRFPVRGREIPGPLWAAALAAEPGTRWDYSDPAFAHLSLAFQGISGQELSQYMKARVFDPIGLEAFDWELMGLADGRIGQHTMPFSGLHLTAREMARFGYLMLRGGTWRGQPLIAPWWVEQATRSSQPYNPNYGLTWWLNSQALWPAVPRDAFAAMGYNCNLCCVVPSLDLVVVRLGQGPIEHTEIIAAPFLAAAAQAVMPG
jgi:CubicO group peptidase (beta-lactamase class C family)